MPEATPDVKQSAPDTNADNPPLVDSKADIKQADAKPGGTQTTKDSQGNPQTTLIAAADDKPDDVKQVVPADFPDNWREKMAGDDKAYLKQLQRYNSPVDFAKKAKSLEAMISSGEYKRQLPADATPEQKAEWRKEQGIPDNPDGYLVDLKLPNGVVLSDADKPIARGFAEAALEGDINPQQYSKLVAKYYDLQDEVKAQQTQADLQFREEAQDDLRSEFGSDYKRTVNSVNALVASMPEGLGDRLLGGRSADGKLLGDDPAMIKWLAGLQREINPLATLAPTTGGSGSDRLAEIRKFRRENPNGYDSDKAMQAEELKLIEATQKMQRRGQAA